MFFLVFIVKLVLKCRCFLAIFLYLKMFLSDVLLQYFIIECDNYMQIYISTVAQTGSWKDHMTNAEL